MIEKTAILVISCDKYSDIWPIYFESLFKYWPNCPLKIYLGSNFKQYNHKDVTMINIGEDSDYSSNLIAMIDKIEEDYIITTVEDIVLSAPMDEKNLFLYFDEFFKNKAAYLKLLYTYPVGYDKDKSKRIAPISSGIKYRLGMGTSLWNKNILKKNLLPGMSAWEMEKDGIFGEEIPADDVYAINYYTLAKPPFKYVHAVMKASWIRKTIPWLVREGFEEHLPLREKLSIRRTLYTYLFEKLMAIFRGINFKWRP